MKLLIYFIMIEDCWKLPDVSMVSYKDYLNYPPLVYYWIIFMNVAYGIAVNYTLTGKDGLKNKKFHEDLIEKKLKTKEELEKKKMGLESLSYCYELLRYTL